MTTRKTWGAIIVAACCLLAGGTGTAWTRDTPAQGNGATHISVNDTVYGVLHNHRSLMSIKENRALLEHELNKARAGFGPRVDVTGEIGVGVLSDTTSRGLNLDDQWLSVGSVSAKLVQPIWDGFATRSRVRAAQATLDSVKARIFDTATSLSLDGIIAHIDLLRRIKLVELARNNVARHESILAQARDRARMGADTQADVTQAESRLQRAHSALAEAEDALRVAYATYSRLTGIYTVGKLDAVPMPAEMPDTAAAFIQMAEKHNPKLAAYLQDIRAAKGEKELAQSAMYPTFQLEAGPEYSDRGGDRDRWVYSFDVLATVRWNVFNSGADVEGIRAASAREREARQNLYDYMDTLRLDMESTWSNYLAAKEQYKFYTKAVENNTYTRQAYHDQFLLGTRSLLDVLDSENELYNSASQAETARGNILVGAYRMCALAGDLLPRMGVPAEESSRGPRKPSPSRAKILKWAGSSNRGAPASRVAHDNSGSLVCREGFDATTGRAPLPVVLRQDVHRMDVKGLFICRKTDPGKHAARKWQPEACGLPMSISCRLCCAVFPPCAASGARPCLPSSCWPGFRAVPSRPRRACGSPARRA